MAVPRVMTGGDLFSRNVTGGWGTSDSGITWKDNTNTDIHDAFYTANTLGYGRTRVVGSDTTNRIIYLDSESAGEQEVLLKMKWSTDNTTDNGPVLRYVSGNDYYFVSLIDSRHQIKLNVRKNNKWSTLKTDNIVLNKDTWYWVRANINATTFRARVWAEGVVEPVSWTSTVSITNNTGPTSGKPGFRTQGEGTSHFVYVDTFYFYNDPSTPVIKNLPVNDTFNRTVTLGAGFSTSGHAWYGSFGDYPETYVSPKLGDVTGSYLTFKANNTLVQDPRGLIGPDEADVEVFARVYSQNSTNNPIIRVGARASDGTSNGLFDYGTGEVYAMLTYGSTTMNLYRDTTNIGSFTLPSAPAAGEQWCMRVMVQASNVYAKAWKYGNSEPAYQITATSVASIAATGQAMFRCSYAASTDNEFRFYEFNVVRNSNANATTVLDLTFSNVRDRSFDATASYTGDNNNNNTVIFQYKKLSDEIWTNAHGIISDDRVNKEFTLDIGGFTGQALDPGGTYSVRAFWSDSDGVNGVNPITKQVTTTLNGTTVERVDLAITRNLGELEVKGVYRHDTDNNSTAVGAYRTVGQASIIQDSFISTDNIRLENHEDDTGYRWQKIAADTVKISDRGYIFPTGATKHLYTLHPTHFTNSTYFVDADIQINSLEGSAGITSRTDGDTYYFIYFTFENDGEWRIGRCAAGVENVYKRFYDSTVEVGDRFHLRIVENGGNHTFYYGKDESNLNFAFNSDDLSITVDGAGGVLFGPKAALERDGIVIQNFKATIPGTFGAWSANFPLNTRSLGVPYKSLSTTLSGLATDTFYEVKVTFSDAAGVYNNPTTSNIIKTSGDGVAFGNVPLSITPFDTSAKVVVNYVFDTDNNSSVVIQYKSIREKLWTTLNPGIITVNRGAKYFQAILPSLIPNLTYQVRVILQDPSGVFFGETEVEGSFVTKGAIIDANKRGKHYLHKIYNIDGDFLDTWVDAPEPEFQWNESGGLSDLAIKLPRKINEANSDPTLQLGNRVDVWAIDTSNMGMGKNMLKDDDMSSGSWVLTTSWSIDQTGGPDGGSTLKFESNSSTIRTVYSENIKIDFVVPLIVQWVGRALGGKLRLDIAAYDVNNNLIDASEDNSETIGTTWQTLKLEWVPPVNTSYVRIRVENVGKGTMWVDKVTMLQKEVMIYRGHIEAVEPTVSAQEEVVNISVYSLAAQLADFMIKFQQYADIQPSQDVLEYPQMNVPPDDPANMMKDIIDRIQAENPRCQLHYTADSIKLTGTIAEYTFKEQNAQDCFDDIINLCPADWSWYIDPDGLVHLQGAQHVRTHILRLNVELLSYSNKKSVEKMKNYIIIRGREDNEEEEPDGEGTIEYIVFDQDSIDKYGRRDQLFRDTNIKDQETAELVGDGRLEELNREEEIGKARVPDEKDIRYVGGALGGYNLESFRPGDKLKILDPYGEGATFWDQFLWDNGSWDDYVNRVLPNDNPIKTIRYKGSEVELSLTSKTPSIVGDYAKLLRWQRLQEAKSSGHR